MRLKSTTLVAQELTLDDESVHFLGPDLRLENCSVESMAKGKNLVVFKAELVNCDFRTMVTLENCPWSEARLLNCRFSGHFLGCDFGGNRDLYDWHGNIVSCDLTNALLDGCQFFDCDLNQMKLPAWPTVWIERPRENANNLLSLDWPDRLQFLVSAVTESPHGTSAVALHAPSIASQYSVSLQDLRHLFGRLDCVTL